jgi:hypothetical protein
MVQTTAYSGLFIIQLFKMFCKAYPIPNDAGFYPEL